MNVQMNIRTGAQTLDDGWRRWIAENLLRGVDSGELIKAMLGAGVDQFLIEQELRSAEENPYLLAARRLQARSAKQLWMASTLGRLEELDPRGVERRDTIDRRTFFEEFYARNRPLILTRALEDWRALSLWSLDYLEEAAAGATVEIQAGRSVDPHYEQYSANHKRVSTWRAFLTALRRGGISNDFYLTANNGATNRQALTALWKDFGPIEGLLFGDWREQGFLWLGPQGTVTPWHHDLTNNFLVQIMGRKDHSGVARPDPTHAQPPPLL